VVDGILQKVEAWIHDFYKDDLTAFVFTADHGMSNRGSHGDGDPQNTETPLIAWGAGISAPNTKEPQGHDQRSIEEWKLGSFQRNDVNQADIAPLMSTLIGVPFPMNSVGVLPIQFLGNTEQYKAEASKLNALGLLQQFLIKQDLKERTEFVFRPYKPLQDVDSILKEIDRLIEKAEYKEAEMKSQKLMELTVDGLRYYQTYDWLLLRTIVTLGYLGWIAYSSLFIIKTYALGVEPTQGTDGSGYSLIISIFGAFCYLLYLKESMISYYAYLFFPVYFWVKVWVQRKFIWDLWTTFEWKRQKSSVYNAFGYLVALEFLVLSYFYREILTLCLLAMGLLWPLFMDADFVERHHVLLRSWKFLCVITSIFTLLPVELEENAYLILFGSLLIICSALVGIIVLPRYINAALPLNQPYKKMDMGLFWWQVRNIDLGRIHCCFYGYRMGYLTISGCETRSTYSKRYCKLANPVSLHWHSCF
jgi:phosphatidylinositol glycan class N